MSNQNKTNTIIRTIPIPEILKITQIHIVIIILEVKTIKATCK